MAKDLSRRHRGPGSASQSSQLSTAVRRTSVSDSAIRSFLQLRSVTSGTELKQSAHHVMVPPCVRGLRARRLLSPEYPFRRIATQSCRFCRVSRGSADLPGPIIICRIHHAPGEKRKYSSRALRVLIAHFFREYGKNLDPSLLRVFVLKTMLQTIGYGPARPPSAYTLPLQSLTDLRGLISA